MVATQAPYPTITKYYNAIRHPQIAFKNLDPILAAGKPIEITNSQGIKNLWSAAGGFACVFKYETFNPDKLWAVRCFLQSTSSIVSHYQKVFNYLKNISCSSYFVEFSFLDQGIRLDGNLYPIVKMEWVEGKDLRTFLKDNLNNKAQLDGLAQAWIQLSKDLESEGLAHGDLQHGNVLIDDSNGIAIKLIDYDSLYLSKIDSNNINDEIKGLLDYQHPLRNKLQKKCIEIDFFPQLVIYISILALADNNSLWSKYNLDKVERLLFSKNDFENPDGAQIFADLSQLSPDVSKLADELKRICKETYFNNIPSLDAVLKVINPLPIDVTSYFTSKAQSSNSKVANSQSSGGQAWNPKSSTNTTNNSGGGQPWNPNSSTNTTNNSASGQPWNPNSSTNTTNNSASGQPSNSSNLTTTIQKLKTDIQDLETENQSLKNNSHDLQTSLNQIKTKYQSLNIQITQQNQKLGLVKVTAVVSTILAATFGIFCYVQYQEINQTRQQIEQLRRTINLLPRKIDYSSLSINLEDVMARLKG